MNKKAIALTIGVVAIGALFYYHNTSVRKINSRFPAGFVIPTVLKNRR